MAIEAIILALDGVLFDLEEAHLSACNTAFEQCGLGLRWTHRHLRNAILKHGAACAITAAVDGLVPPPRPAEIRALVEQKDMALRTQIMINPPAPDQACMTLIRHALQSGCKLALVTDLPSTIASILLDRAFGENSSSVFATVVSGANFISHDGNGPHALVLRTIGVDARDCLMIDTTQRGLACANEMGMQTLLANEMKWVHVTTLPAWNSAECPSDKPGAPVQAAFV